MVLHWNSCQRISNYNVLKSFVFLFKLSHQLFWTNFWQTSKLLFCRAVSTFGCFEFRFALASTYLVPRLILQSTRSSFHTQKHHSFYFSFLFTVESSNLDNFWVCFRWSRLNLKATYWISGPLFSLKITHFLSKGLFTKSPSYPVLFYFIDPAVLKAVSLTLFDLIPSL